MVLSGGSDTTRAPGRRAERVLTGDGWAWLRVHDAQT